MGRHDRYPEWDKTWKKSEPGGECACCNQVATHGVAIRFGPMRGTDIDDLDVCGRHKNMAEKNLRRFLAHERSKDKFLNRPQQKEPSDG